MWAQHPWGPLEEYLVHASQLSNARGKTYGYLFTNSTLVEATPRGINSLAFPMDEGLLHSCGHHRPADRAAEAVGSDRVCVRPMGEC